MEVIQDKNNDLRDCPHPSPCLEGNTCCSEPDGGIGCCPYKDGICCKDGHHCCPSGTHCDLVHMRCIRRDVSFVEYIQGAEA